MPPWKTPMERVQWILSETDLNRVPYEFDVTRPALHLIGVFYIQRYSSGLYLITWKDGDESRQMERPSLLQWLDETQGETPPPLKAEDIANEWLSVPQIERMYNVPENTVRLRLNNGKHPEGVITKIKGGKWRVRRDYAKQMYGTGQYVTRSGALNLDTFKPDTSEMLHITQTPDIRAVQNYVYRHRPKLKKRGLIRIPKRGQIYINKHLVQLLWGK